MDNSITILKDSQAELGYNIKKGINPKQIDQLIDYSQTDESVAKFTSDKSRFKDVESFNEFSTHIISYYVLTDQEDNLLGIVWFDDFALGYEGEVEGRNPSEYGISFAIRTYDKARGRGLSNPFTAVALEDFKNSEQYKNHPNKRIWLAVSPDNYAAISSYKKSGFKELGMKSDGKKLLMILKDH